MVKVADTIYGIIFSVAIDTDGDRYDPTAPSRSGSGFVAGAYSRSDWTAATGWDWAVPSPTGRYPAG